MHAEIREKESETMKGEKKINSREENVYPLCRVFTSFLKKRRGEEYMGTRLWGAGEVGGKYSDGGMLFPQMRKMIKL